MSLSHNEIVLKEFNSISAACISNLALEDIEAKSFSSERLRVYYRKLNPVIHADRYTSPNVDEILGNMSGELVSMTRGLSQG